MKTFINRADAGKQLAEKLLPYRRKKDAIILALPRGGVPVAYEIARALHLPMTVFLVRKLGVPGHEELAMGAVAEGHDSILNHDLIKQLRITEEQIQTTVEKENAELQRRLELYLQGKHLPNFLHKTIILVDDGIATGSTCKAAIHALKTFKIDKLILATPVASQESMQELSSLADEVVCLMTPTPFFGVGQWYQRFDQLSDEEVLTLLYDEQIRRE